MAPALLSTEYLCTPGRTHRLYSHTFSDLFNKNMFHSVTASLSPTRLSVEYNHSLLFLMCKFRLSLLQIIFSIKLIKALLGELKILLR